MKKFLIFSIVLLLILLLLPLAKLSSANINPISTPTNNSSIEPNKSDNFKVLLSDQNQIVTLSAEDYLLGVLAGEMPALYEIEALKAQVVCAYTFALWRKNENHDKEYDITDDYTIDQCYLTPSAAKEKWGNKAGEYEEKLQKAVNEVLHQKLTYNDQIILSVYHSLSSGYTENAKDIWGKDYPYLQSVSSIGDKLATNYITTVTVTPEQVENTLSVNLPSGIKGSFTDFSRTKSGSVKKLKVGGKEFEGGEIRKAFNLKSSNFQVELKDDVFTFIVYGYGHGVGMSQNGANYMAQQGSDYVSILKHYYKNCEIKE